MMMGCRLMILHFKTINTVELDRGYRFSLIHFIEYDYNHDIQKDGDRTL